MARLKGFLSLTILVLVALTIGSYFMRARVIRQLQNRALADSSAVLTRPFPITNGTNVNASRLTKRLERLGYQKIEVKPSLPGQFAVTKGRFFLFLRGASLATGDTQKEQLVQLSLDPAGVVTGLLDEKFGEPLNRVWLEPEMVSLLGTSATRASVAKALSSFPKHVVDAVLAIEDERFYYHYGVDPVAISRAIVANLSAGHIVQGGSTITQQLAKNLFFTSERSFVRKFREVIDAVLIETAFTKEQILEAYLNEVFLTQEGHVAIHGFPEASRSFFGKEVENITIAEAALLAGIIKGPTKFSPRRNPTAARTRQRLVLENMHSIGMITEPQLKAALDEKIKIIPARRSSRLAPYFVDYLRKQLEQVLNTSQLSVTDLQIQTGLDAEFQLCAQNALQSGLAKLEKTYGRLSKRKKSPVQGALISVNASSGEVTSWVGGRNYQQNQFDRISQAHRQPGSAFKPFVYLTALDGSLNSYRVARPTSLLDDKPLSLEVPGTGIWQPKNYDDDYVGETTLREALTHSRNIPTINLALKTGLPAVKRTAEILGFMSELAPVPSLALGAMEVTPLELIRAYATIANGGMRINLRPLVAVTTARDGRVFYRAALDEQRVVGEPSVFVLTNILRSVIESGTGNTVRRLGFTAPAAGKTGTTNDARDAWFVGFTPRILALVWVGFDDNSELGLTGSQAAAPIWTEFMKCASPMEPELDFVPPEGVVFRRIDRLSGLLATDSCPSEDIIQEVFVEGTEPVTECDLHGSGAAAIYDERRELSELPPAQQQRLPDYNAPSRPKRSIWDNLFNR